MKINRSYCQMKMFTGFRMPTGNLDSGGLLLACENMPKATSDVWTSGMDLTRRRFANAALHGEWGGAGGVSPRTKTPGIH
jgi:hypothetical protein